MSRLNLHPTADAETIRRRYMGLAPTDLLRKAFERGLSAALAARCPYDGRTREARAWNHGRQVAMSRKREAPDA